MSRAPSGLFCPILLCAALLIAGCGSPNTAVMEQSSNQVAGTWSVVSAVSVVKGQTVEPYGPSPAGSLIFTSDMHFSIVINRQDTPRFVSGSSADGTDKENAAAVAQGLGLFGTYRVDDQGVFLDQHVTGSTFPNWNGIDRGRDLITESVEGDQMIERFSPSPDTEITIVWRTAEGVSVVSSRRLPRSDVSSRSMAESR